MKTPEIQTVQVIQPASQAVEHGVTYLERAFGNPASIISEAMTLLAGVQYDTLVGTGLSGALVVPTLARALGRHFMIVRKENDGSHSMYCAAGALGSRWLFVDDQVNTGTTLARVRKAIKRVQVARSYYESEFVGVLTYGHSETSECELVLASRLAERYPYAV